MNKNWIAMGILLFAIALLFSAIVFPAMQSLFNFNNPVITAFLPVLILVFILLGFLELQKYITNKRANDNQSKV